MHILEAILESGRRKKYFFYRVKIGRPLSATPPPTLTVPERSTSALECLVFRAKRNQSEVTAVEEDMEESLISLASV